MCGQAQLITMFVVLPVFLVSCMQAWPVASDSRARESSSIISFPEAYGCALYPIITVRLEGLRIVVRSFALQVQRFENLHNPLNHLFHTS